jgi:hypothetical protein
MTAIIVIVIIAVIFIGIALLRIGATVVYSVDGPEVLIHIGFVRIVVYPRDKIAKKKLKKKGDKAKTQKETKQGGSIEKLKFLMSADTVECLRRLTHRLSINQLTMYYCAAGYDPAETAIHFGMASAAFGIVLPFLENHFHIKQRDLRTAVDFSAQESTIFVHIKMTLAVWEIIYIALALLDGLRKMSAKKSNNGKVENENGQTSDR